MVSTGLEDAFFYVHIQFQFTHVPNGQDPAITVFTKTKVLLLHLRKLHYASVVYVDDSYLQGNTYYTCPQNVIDTIIILRELGFVLNLEISILTTTQTIVFLGSVISSENMTVTLTNKEKTQIKTV